MRNNKILVLALALIFAASIVLSGQVAALVEHPIYTTAATTKPASTTTVAATTAATTTKPATTAAAPITWKLAGYFPINNPITKASERFASLVKERTNGRLVIQTFQAQSLFKGGDLHDAVSKGLVEIADYPQAYAVANLPILDVSQLPFPFENVDHVSRFLNGGARAAFAQMSQKENIVPLYYTLPGATATGAKTKFLKSPADWKNVLIRAGSPLNTRWAEMLGAKPVTIASSEQYLALKMGTIDAFITSSGNWLAFKLHDVTDYMTIDSIILPVCWVTANKDAWNKLSPDLQKIVQDTALQIESELFQSANQAMTTDIEKLKTLVKNSYKLTPQERQVLKTQTQPVYDWFASTYGPDAKTLLDLLEKTRKP